MSAPAYLKVQGGKIKTKTFIKTMALLGKVERKVLWLFAKAVKIVKKQLGNLVKYINWNLKIFFCMLVFWQK